MDIESCKVDTRWFSYGHLAGIVSHTVACAVPEGMNLFVMAVHGLAVSLTSQLEEILRLS